MSSTDALRLRSDDLGAHAAWARGLARALLADPSAADDALQETWLAALRSPPASDRPVRPWLRTVLRNVIRKQHRSASRRDVRERAAARPESVRHDPADLVERLETQRRITDAVHALAEPYRTAILLRFMEGLEPAEIARRQGVPATTVRSHVHRGVALLRTELDARHHGDRRAWAAPLVALAAAKRSRRPRVGVIAGVGALVVVALLAGWGASSWSTAGADGEKTATLSAPVDDGDAGNGPAAESPAGRTRRHVAQPPVSTGEPPAPAAVDESADPPLRAAQPSSDGPAWTDVVARFVDTDKRPIADVSVEGDGATTTTSATDGRVRVRVDTGALASDQMIHVRARAPGRASRTLRARALRDRDVLLGDIVLTPGGGVSGRVTDLTGRGIGQVWIVATADKPDAIGERGGGSATTDHDGSFRIDGLPVGDVGLWAQAEGYEDQTIFASVHEGELTQSVTIGMTATKPDGRGVAGRVLSPTGEPVAGAEVIYLWEGEFGGASGGEDTAEDGTFALPDAEGACFLGAYDLEERWAPVVLGRVAIGRRDVVLQFPEPRAIRFRVQDDLGAAVGEFEVSLIHSEWKDEPIHHVSAEGGVASLLVPAATVVVTFDVPGCELLELGPWDAAKLGEEDERLVRVQRLRTVTGRVALPAGAASNARLTAWQLTADGLRVVVNEFASRVLPDAVTETTAGDDGTFEITLREAGSYVVRAEQEGFPAVESEPFAFDPAIGLALPELRLDVAGAIEGTVRDETGAPVAGALVGCCRGNAFARSVRADAAGRFRFDGVAAGGWQVRAVSRDLSPQSRSTTFARGEAPAIVADCRVVAGKTTVHDVLTHSAGVHVATASGAIDGRFPAGGVATLSDADGREVARAEMNDRGRWELATLSDGAHVLRLRVGDLEFERRFDASHGAASHARFWIQSVAAEGPVPPGRGGELAFVREAEDSVWVVAAARVEGDHVVGTAPAGDVRLCRRGPKGSAPATWEVLVRFVAEHGEPATWE